MPRHTKTLQERFDENYTPEPMSGCWLWLGPVGMDGRARIKLGQRPVTAARVVYQLWHGAIPDGLFVLHSCDNILCVNPDHLRVGTHMDNMRDTVIRKRRLGRKHTPVKLNSMKADEIRRLAGSMPMTQLGKRYGVSRRTVADIITGKTWKINNLDTRTP